MANEVQRLTANALSGDGQFDIHGNGDVATVLFFGGAVAAEGELRDALETLFPGGEGFDFTITDNLDNTFDIEFIGPFANTNVDEMTVTDFLGSGTPPSFTTLVEGGGTAKAVLFHNHYQQQGMR